MRIKMANLFACMLGATLCGVASVGFVMNLDYWGWWLIAGLASSLVAVIAENN